MNFEIFYLIMSVVVFELIIFLLSVITKKQDIADVFWGPTFIFIATVIYFIKPQINAISIVISLLTIIWGTRLSLHIYKRNLGKKEDIRYTQLSKNWGNLYYLRSFVQTFLLQGILALLILIPLISLYLTEENTVNMFFVYCGLLVWIFGFIFEVISDDQLSKFIKIKKTDQIMDKGLWKYSRHPNYFGEVTLWWGIYIISLSNINGGIFTIIGPITITILILFVSGIPMLEKRYSGNEEYQLYKKRTSIFIPLPPKQ